MAIDTAAKRFAMLNMASGAVYPRLIEPDGAVDADDRAHFLRIYGGNPLDNPSGVTTQLLQIPHTLDGGFGIHGGFSV